MQHVIDEILLAKKENRIAHFKKFNLDVPKWKDFIKNINYKFHNIYTSEMPNDDRFLKNFGKQTEIMEYNNLDLVSHHSAVFFKNKDLFYDSVFNNMRYIHDMVEPFLMKNFERTHVKAITNFIGNDQKYYIHTDSTDVINLHCVGNIEWRIYKDYVPGEDNDSKPYESLFIEPGDMIFMPSGIAHQVIVSEPRASLLFDFMLGDM